SANANYDTRFKLLKRLGKTFKELKINWTLFASGNFCIEKECFTLSGGFDEDFIHWGVEDIEFAYRLKRMGYLFEIIDNPVIHLMTTPGKPDIQRYRGSLKNIGLFYEKYKDPQILLIMLMEDFTFDCFCSMRGWDEELHIKRL